MEQINVDLIQDVETLDNEQLIAKYRQYEAQEKQAKQIKEYFKKELLKRAETTPLETQRYSVSTSVVKTNRIDTKWAKSYFEDNLIEPKMVESESVRLKVEFKLPQDIERLIDNGVTHRR